MATKIKCARCRTVIPQALASSCYYSLKTNTRGTDYYYVCPECAEKMQGLLTKEKEPKEERNVF